MKLKQRLLSMLSAAALTLTAVPAAPVPAEAANSDLYCQTFSGSNIGRHNYSRWAAPSTSDLVPSGTGWMRVQGGAIKATDSENPKALIEYYSSDFKLQSRKTVTMQLPVWGAFHAGKDGNYYLITGQNNPDKDNSLPVLDIAKYSSDWTLVKHVSVKNSSLNAGSKGITGPFDAGTLRCADDGTWLILNMGREMYSGHQANLAFQIKMSTMSGLVHTDANGIGYTSHSFNQFVLLDGTHAVTISHGDAYPRAVVLDYFKADYTEGNLSSSGATRCTLVPFTDAADFNNMTEVNYTGASVGGFAKSSTNYIIAYNSINQNKIADYWSNYSDPYTRNIMIASVSRSNLSGTVSRWTVTNYKEDTEKGQTPYLVQTGTDAFAVLWQRGSQVNYTTLDKTGKPSGTIKTFDGALSDCEPVVKNGKIYWYTWNNETVTLYSMNAQNPTALNTVVYKGGHAYEQLTEADEAGNVTLHCTKCGEEKQIVVPTACYAYWTTSDNPNSYSTRFPDNADAGKQLIVRARASAPDGVTSSEYIMEVTEGAEYLTPVDPDSTDFKQYFQIGQFDPESVRFKLRIYPKYNPSAEKVYSYSLKHSYEITETVPPSGSTDGHITYHCTGCGHTYQKILSKLTPLSATSIHCTVNDSACKYNGSPYEPKFTVTVTGSDGTQTELQQGVDFTAAYSDNINAGKGKITLTALPDSLYVTGKSEILFTIQPQELKSGRITILSNPDRDPDKVLTPDITVKDDQGNELTAGQDYICEYTENTINVSGKGNYTGTIGQTFSPNYLYLSSCTAAFADPDFDTERKTPYTGNPVAPEIILKDGERILRPDIDYTVSWENNTNAGRVYGTITGTGAYKGQKASISRSPR